MLATDTSSTKMCGATRDHAGDARGKRAAYSSAIEPPSLWPKSHGLSVDAERGEEAPAAPRAPARA